MKKALKILVAVILIFIGISTALFFYFEKNIQPILVAEINKSLAVRVNVDDISITRLQDFPKVGVRLSNIAVDESSSFFNDKLIQANEINLYVNLLKLYQGDYVIDEILIRDGTICIADLENSNNYNIIKSSNNNTSSNISFEISRLKLVNCNFKYEYIPTKTKLNGFVSNSSIQLKYVDSSTFLNIKSDFDKLNLYVGNEGYIKNKDVSLDTKISINSNRKMITIDPSNLIIENINLLTQGKISYNESSTIDITFKNKKTDAKRLLDILPPNIKQSFDAIQLSGDLAIDGFVKGNVNNKISLGFDYLLYNADLLIKESKIGINQLHASGQFLMPNIGSIENAQFNCGFKSASKGNNQIKGVVKVTNFKKPKIKWKGKAQIDPIFIAQFSDNSNFIPSGGNINLDGTLNLVYDINQSKIEPKSFHYKGTVNLNNIQGQITNPKISVHQLNIELKTDSNRLVFNNGQINYNQTQAYLEGYISTIESIFDHQSKSKLIGHLKIDNLNINELLVENTSPKTVNKSDELSPFKFNLTTEIKNFKVNDFVAQSLKGRFISDKKSIQMSDLSMVALDGSVHGKIIMKNWGDHYLLDIQSKLEEVNIQKMFKQFDNFYQNEITDKNISGTLNGNLIAKIILNDDYEPILPKLYAKSTIEVNNGSLTGYEPLKELSSFVDIKDLENVKFKKLENSIEIFDETIFIPKMKIENNALNLEIEGTHTFDNLMSYAMEISIAELLATKANWIAKKAEKRIERNKTGGLTAYVMIEGTPDDLKIRYDRSTVKENIKEEVKNEKKKFIQTLKGENTLEDQKVNVKNYEDVWDE